MADVERQLAAGGVKALEFDGRELGRWDSASMVRVLALHDRGAQLGAEFRAQTLPEGLAKLVALSQAVPEKKDAVRQELKPSFLERVGEPGLAAWTGGRAMGTMKVNHPTPTCQRGGHAERVDGRPEPRTGAGAPADVEERCTQLGVRWRAAPPLHGALLKVEHIRRRRAGRTLREA